MYPMASSDARLFVGDHRSGCACILWLPVMPRYLLEIIGVDVHVSSGFQFRDGTLWFPF